MQVVALLSLFLVGAHGFGRLLLHSIAHERVGMIDYIVGFHE